MPQKTEQSEASASNKRSNYEEIMEQQLLPVLRQHPGYKIHVTGHGLGAALAILFGVMVAAEPDEKVPKPISIVSFASPFVGDESFRSLHRLLESQGKLRHVRIINHNDTVTLGPTMSWQGKVQDKGIGILSFYKQVGMSICLFEDDSVIEISYPKVRSGYFASMMDDFLRGVDHQCCLQLSCNPFDFWKPSSHGIRHYNRRVIAHKVILQAIRLNELYARPDIVGQLVHHF